MLSGRSRHIALMRFLTATKKSSFLHFFKFQLFNSKDDVLYLDYKFSVTLRAHSEFFVETSPLGPSEQFQLAPK